MMKLNERVLATREAGAVGRCHTLPTIRSQDVAQHTYGVMCLLYLLFPRLALSLLPFALFHDFPERWTGDIPSPVKRQAGPEFQNWIIDREMEIASMFGVPSEHDLGPEMKAILVACDRLEFFLWATEEAFRGNGSIERAREEVRSYIISDPSTPKVVLDFIHDGKFFRLPENLESVK